MRGEVPVDALEPVFLCTGDMYNVRVARDRTVWNYHYVATDSVTILIKIKTPTHSSGEILYAPIHECVIEWLVDDVPVDPRQFEI